MMSPFLAILSLESTAREVEAVYTKTPPVIDGRMDEVWYRAKPAVGFIQQSPDEGRPASESTEVYVLYDDANLYVAFRCYQDKVKAWVSSWDDVPGDRVTLYLDTFGDKRTAYGFTVNALGVQGDFIVTNDGRSFDDSWDGIWWAAARITSDGYVVEMKIPFKSIRYRKGLDRWGVNFKRHIVSRGETDYWEYMSRTERLRVSKFGQLVGIHPSVSGRYLEFYPVGLIRNDEYLAQPSETRPHVGLDLAWSPGPQTQINLTANPDFGEVEADPYKINLSKYRLFYQEKRPFFTQGAEYFHVTPEIVVSYDFMTYLFYSRNVGRKLITGEEVPISVGAKLTHKSDRWELGYLLVRTEPKVSEVDSEPLSYFSVLRSKYTLFGNSTIGMLLETKESPEVGKHTRVASVDLNLRSATSVFSAIGALAGIRSDSQEVLGKYMSIGHMYQGRSWLSLASLTHIGSDFDINELGFVGLPGILNAALVEGPVFFPESGPVLSLFTGIGGGIFREFAEGVNEWGGGFHGEIQLRNLWGGGLGIFTGKAYEQGQYFTQSNVEVNVHGPNTGDLRGGVWSWFNYSYNYNRGHFGWQGGVGTWTDYSLNPSFSIKLETNSILEFGADRSLEEVTFIATPRLSWNITRDIEISSYVEAVSAYTTKKIERVRIGGLFKWRMAPKSWFYIALNDLEARDTTAQPLPFTTAERIALVKIRYLFYF